MRLGGQHRQVGTWRSTALALLCVGVGWVALTAVEASTAQHSRQMAAMQQQPRLVKSATTRLSNRLSGHWGNTKRVRSDNQQQWPWGTLVVTGLCNHCETHSRSEMKIAKFTLLLSERSLNSTIPRGCNMSSTL